MIPRSQRFSTRSSQTRDLTTVTLSLRADTLDVEARSIEAVLSTENPVAVIDWSRFELIDEVLRADGAEFPEQVPLLDSHARYSCDDVLGSIRNISVRSKQVVGRLFFATDDERADKVWNKVRQGHLTDVSIGYRVLEHVDVPPNQKATINGRSYKAGPRGLRVATKYLIREGSVTPIGADAAAKMRSEAGLSPQTPKEGTSPMNEQLRKYLESLGLRTDATDEQAEAFRAALGGEQLRRADALEAGTETFELPSDSARSASAATGTAPTAGQAGSAGEALRGVSSNVVTLVDPAQPERDRQRSIRELAGADVPAELVTRACDEGWDLARASQEFLSSIRAARQTPVEGAPFGHVRRTEGDEAVRAIAGGLMIRAAADRVRPGMRDAERQQLEETLNRGERFRSLSLPDVARECLRAEGRSVPHDREEMVRSAVSTQAFASVVERTVNAAVLIAFTEAPDTTNGWVRERDVPNFKQNDRYAAGKTGGLKKLGRGGQEAEHATSGDDKTSYRIFRYAKQFVMDEQDIIDDDLGLLQDTPIEMGVAARRLRPDLVYALLLANGALADAVALFHATHKNLGTAGTALSAASLAAAITAMGKQTITAKDGKTVVNLNIVPRFLIVPQDLQFTAKELIRSTQIVIAGNTDTVRGNFNTLSDLDLQLRIDNRLGVAGVTNPDNGTAYAGTATNWFLAAEPVAGRTVEVGYLAGTGRMPQTRRFVLDKGRWGVGVDIKHDIGATVLSHEGLYKATGAA